MNQCDNESLLCNLTDAGCDENTARVILFTLQNGNKKEALAMIERHRKELLKNIHTGEKHISYLDYLVYKLKDNKE